MTENSDCQADAPQNIAAEQKGTTPGLDLDEPLTLQQAAEQVTIAGKKVSYQTLARYCRQGMDHGKFGRSIIVTPRAIREFALNRETPSKKRTARPSVSADEEHKDIDKKLAQYGL